MEGVGTLASPDGPPREFNGHYYQWVAAEHHYAYNEFSVGIDWHAAQLDAAGRCYKGQRGYLATIDSANEQAFIQTLIPTITYNKHYFVGWVGGSDVNQEGDWRWADGPDRGVAFYNGDGSSGHAVPTGGYTNWYCEQDTDWNYCEPNNSNNQDCMHLYGDGYWNGAWNDGHTHAHAPTQTHAHTHTHIQTSTAVSKQRDISVNTGPIESGVCLLVLAIWLLCYQQFGKIGDSSTCLPRGLALG